FENGVAVLTLAGDANANLTLEPDALGGTEVFFGNDVWKNAAGGDWGDGSSWSSGVPTSETDAVIGVSGTYTVTIAQSDESDQANSLAITNAAATLTGSGT